MCIMAQISKCCKHIFRIIVIAVIASTAGVTRKKKRRKMKIDKLVFTIVSLRMVELAYIY
jgi:hypothetical protein